ncbi:hypothetical protein RWE15_23850 [Virgibacillus halophilus]|uniref:Uncharacterized protein n=1 Tax=Tigheibacillus halophilus TaxID=361280 RepID=A0ABU5CDW6_9BACI|nr:hypothetical protein [Virgibacillus halophilus]
MSCKKRYDDLAKKSGLSKDEIKRLFKANDDIIKQSPGVKKSISEQGNEFAKNTDAVREYIDSLREATLEELKGQRSKALSQEKELRSKINSEQKELNGLLDEMQVKTDASKLSTEENKARQEEINKLLQDRTISAEKGKSLQEELTALMDVENGDHANAVDRLQEKINKKKESIEGTQEEIEKNKVLEQQMGDLVLKQSGITAEGEKGLVALDKSIAKNEQEMAKLDAKLEKNGKLTVKEQERYDALAKTNQKQKEAKQYLNEELGLYSSINSLAEAKLGKLSKEKQTKVENLAKTRDIKVEEGNIVKQLENKNKKLLEERQKHGANKKEIDKQIAANDTVLVKILDELGLWGKVSKNIDLASDKIGKKNKVIEAGTGKLKNQGSQQDANNSKTSKGIGLEEKRTKEAGRSVNKKVTAQDHGTVAAIDKRATTPKTKKITAKDYGSIASLDRLATLTKSKKVNVTDAGSVARLDRSASSPVTKTINFVARGLDLLKSKFWAKGTPPSGHPGGNAVMGDGGGRELAQLPDGRMFLSPDKPTFYPGLPKGTHVIPHRETAKMLSSVKHYARGTKDYKNTEFMKLLDLNRKRSETTVYMPRSQSSSNKKRLHERITRCHTAAK